MRIFLRLIFYTGTVILFSYAQSTQAAEVFFGTKGPEVGLLKRFEVGVFLNTGE